MKKYKVILLSVTMILRASCSRSVDIEDRGDGVCVQVSKSSLFGIGRSHENLIKCPKAES